MAVAVALYNGTDAASKDNSIFLKLCNYQLFLPHFFFFQDLIFLLVQQ